MGGRRPAHQDRARFDDERELCHCAQDYSDSNNLADEYPERLEELKAIFGEAARAYNVCPLYDDMVQPIGQQQDLLFGDQKEFVDFAPGAARIAGKSSATVKNRAHTIETQIELSGNEAW